MFLFQRTNIIFNSVYFYYLYFYNAAFAYSLTFAGFVRRTVEYVISQRVGQSDQLESLMLTDALLSVPTMANVPNRRAKQSVHRPARVATSVSVALLSDYIVHT